MSMDWEYKDGLPCPVWTRQSAGRYLAIAKGEIGAMPFALYAFDGDCRSQREMGEYGTLEEAKAAAELMEAAA